MITPKVDDLLSSSANNTVLAMPAFVPDEKKLTCASVSSDISAHAFVELIQPEPIMFIRHG
jgi:hypothetical protein